MNSVGVSSFVNFDDVAVDDLTEWDVPGVQTSILFLGLLCIYLEEKFGYYQVKEDDYTRCSVPVLFL